MVKGLNIFREFFSGYEEQYVLIGGAACDIIFESNEVSFRATKDLDVVLIVEALTPEFGGKLWEFIEKGGYRNKLTNLSAILLDEDYYKALISGKVIENNISVLKPEYLILFKAKAYMDLRARRESGENVDSNNIKKHKKDILRICSELILEKTDKLPVTVETDIHNFIHILEKEPYDDNSLKMYGVNNDDIIQLLKSIY